jgi:hypothetical protein
VQLYVDATSPPRKDQIVAAFRSFGLPVYVTEFAVNLRHATGSQQQRFDLQARIYEDVTAAVLASGVARGFSTFRSATASLQWRTSRPSRSIRVRRIQRHSDDLQPKPALYAQRRALLATS